MEPMEDQQVDQRALKVQSQRIAMEICVRGLIASHPDLEELRQAIEDARADMLDVMEGVYRDTGGPAAVVQLSVAVDVQLHRLTHGLAGVR
ncbi:MAG: hypothetical protein GAK28_03201 [Luteibacter sp.]|uniref:hypothetical protein n=1 Tax=Luteibacter sp. TaxID=1886636 RepID=UPI0013833CCF|nr:hypothetical protein [Luteibacter sp.]KAF1005449.1 MAG: hypothetical protein GAK28_03201 [Luteibacter sp.]